MKAHVSTRGNEIVEQMAKGRAALSEERDGVHGGRPVAEDAGGREEGKGDRDGKGRDVEPEGESIPSTVEPARQPSSLVE